MNKRTFRFLSSRQNIPFQPTRKWCFFHVVSSKQCKENKLSCMFHSSSVIKTCYLILLQALEETHDSTFRGTQHDLRHFLRFSGIGCQHWSSERKCDSCTVIRVICIIGDTHHSSHHSSVTVLLWLPLQLVARNKHFQGMIHLGHSICVFQGKTSKTPLTRSLLNHKKAKSNFLEVDICITDVNIQPKESHSIQSSVV